LSAAFVPASCAVDALRALILAAVAAAVASTLIQILLWWGFTGASPWPLLSRDARLTAAIVTGRKVLLSSGAFDPAVWLVAAFIHFMLSIIYAAIVAYPASRFGIAASMAIGTAAGVMIYIVNLYGFTAIFPWFVQSRSGITLLAHAVFGATLAGTYRMFHGSGSAFRRACANRLTRFR
jgi:hypothetical protein